MEPSLVEKCIDIVRQGDIERASNLFVLEYGKIGIVCGRGKGIRAEQIHQPGNRIVERAVRRYNCACTDVGLMRPYQGDILAVSGNQNIFDRTGIEDCGISRTKNDIMFGKRLSQNLIQTLVSALLNQ